MDQPLGQCPRIVLFVTVNVWHRSERDVSPFHGHHEFDDTNKWKDMGRRITSRSVTTASGGVYRGRLMVLYRFTSQRLPDTMHRVNQTIIRWFGESNGALGNASREHQSTYLGRWPEPRMTTRRDLIAIEMGMVTPQRRWLGERDVFRYSKLLVNTYQSKIDVKEEFSYVVVVGVTRPRTTGLWVQLRRLSTVV